MRKNIPTNAEPIEFKTHVLGLSYVFHLDGSIETFIHVDPAIVIHGAEYHKFPIDESDKDMTIANGDELIITINGDPQTKAIANIEVHPTTECARIQVHPDVCPVCGHQLVASKMGIGRCLNRSCRAQLTQNITHFLAACGMSLRYPVSKILGCLFTRGGLKNISDIFNVEITDLAGDHIDSLEAQVFLQQLHGIRGHVTVAMFLQGLRVQGWTMEDVTILDKCFQEREWSVLDIPQLFNSENFDICPSVNWSGWEELISEPNNRQDIEQLAQLLYI